MSRVMNALAASVLFATPLVAQTVTPARSCPAPNVKDAWYKMQADWWALDAKHDWTDDTLRTLLLGAAKNLEPPLTGPFPIALGVTIPGTMVPGKLDLAAISRTRAVLLELSKTRGKWPVRSTIGVAGVHAAWLLLGTDTTLATAGLHAMMEAGPDESSAFDVAIMEDKLRLGRGRKQIYASQFGANRQPQPTEDLAHVDMRRDAAGLPPLAWALCAAGKRK